MSGSRMFNPGWHLCGDLKSMLTVSEAVAKSALARRESRGAHSRIDFPNYDETWAKQNNIISQQGESMLLKQQPTTPLPAKICNLCWLKKERKLKYGRRRHENISR